MHIHAISKNDSQGDTVDMEYQCGTNCMETRLKELDDGQEPYNYEAGAWPCGSETDHDVYCSNCNTLLWYGLINADCQ